MLGEDPADGGRTYRERIGIVLQEAGFDEDFTVRELVRLTRRMYPRRWGVDEVIELVGLAEKARRAGQDPLRRATPPARPGAGPRRRPELLFLDEPTTGFDPSAAPARGTWWGLRDLGKTVLLTTHYMDEAEHLADRVGVMVAGRLVALGTPARSVRPLRVDPILRSGFRGRVRRPSCP